MRVKCAMRLQGTVTGERSAQTESASCGSLQVAAFYKRLEPLLHSVATQKLGPEALRQVQQQSRPMAASSVAVSRHQ